MRTQIKRLHAMLRTTMIYVTHDQTEAMTLADRVVVLRGGHIVQQGAPMELYSNPETRFVGEFIGSPQMNIMSGILDRSGDVPQLRLGDQAMPLGAVAAADGARIDVGVRPEHLTLAGQGAEMIRAVPEVFEPLGSDLMAICSFSEHELTARLDPNLRLTAGTPIPLSYAIEDLHYFDAETGKRLATV